MNTAETSDAVVLLRPATVADLDDVVALEHRPEHAGAIAQWPRHEHERWLADPTCRLLIIEVDGKFGGSVHLRGVGTDIVEMERLVVRDKHRGHGRKALDALFRYAYSRAGATAITLDVVDTNERARHVYEKAGFSIDGFRSHCLNGRDVRLVLMSRPLDGPPGTGGATGPSRG